MEPVRVAHVPVTRLSFLVTAMVVVGCNSPPPPLVALDSSIHDAFVPPRPDAWTPPDAWTFSIAPHGPGNVVPNQGGARLTHPQLVIITYADDPDRAAIEAHASWLVGSSWLTTVGAEYGIGAGSILANVERTDAAPDTITTAGIETLIAAGVADHSLPMAADGTFQNVLYVIYFPEHTMITDPMLGTSCTSYGGYHYEIDTGPSPYSYAVIPTCPRFVPGLSGAEFEQEAMAHEVIEAATDALPTSAPAYEFHASALETSPWLFLGPELADLCALRVGTNSFIRDPSGYIVPRMWSNMAAADGDRDPCIPADPARPYRSIAITPSSTQFVTAGSTATFDVLGWTTAPVPDYFLYAAPAGTFTPDVSLDRSMINNGQHATLTVTIPPGTPVDTYAIVYVEFGIDTTEYDAQPVVVYVR